MGRQTTSMFILLGLAAIMLTDMDGSVEKVENLDANDIDLDKELDENDDVDEYLKDQETQSTGRHMIRTGGGQTGPRGEPIRRCKYVNEKICRNVWLVNRYVRFCFYQIVRVC